MEASLLESSCRPYMALSCAWVPQGVWGVMSEPGTLALFHRLVHQSSEVEIGAWETEDEADVRRSRRTVAYRQAARGPGWFRRLCGACASAALASLPCPGTLPWGQGVPRVCAKAGMPQSASKAAAGCLRPQQARFVPGSWSVVV